MKRKTFVEMLAELRALGGYTQKDLAKKLGYSPQYLNDVEHSRRKPSPELVLMIVTVFPKVGMRSDWMAAGARASGWDV